MTDSASDDTPTPDSPTPDSPDGPGPSRTTTGHPGVDGIVAEVDRAADEPLTDRVERLTSAHEQLHAVLDEHRRTDGQPG